MLAAIHWEGFLNRPPLALNQALPRAALEGKRILITGAGGSIGSALTRSVVQFAPARLLLLEASERSLYEIDSELQQEKSEHGSILGSVSDPGLLADIFCRHRPQIVYHAAAFKHVPLMELNPFSAIENNAIGTQLLLDAAVRGKAEQLILLSTDKAVDPLSIMGASKRIAELILLTASPRTKAVRLGNVLGSQGSIVPLFLKQILSGEPVTVAHPDARRYFLTTKDAVTLLLFASLPAALPGVLVPELGEPKRVEALARYLMASTESVPVVFTQLRPGDKLCEALLSGRESYTAEPGPMLRAVHSPGLTSTALDGVLLELKQACRERSLKRLLAAVSRAVPEYQPSALLERALETA